MSGRSGVAADERAVELRVEPARRQQFLVHALLDEPSAVHDQDLVRFGDGGEAVGDHERGSVDQRGGEGILHSSLVLRIEVTGRLIEDHDRRILEEHAGDCEALLLTAGEPVAPLADHGVEPVGQPFDDLEHLGGTAGFA